MKGGVMTPQALLDVLGAGRHHIHNSPHILPRTHAEHTAAVPRAQRLWLIGMLAAGALMPLTPLAVAQTVQGTQATQAGRAATAAGRNAAAARAAQAVQAPTAGNAGTRFLEACQAAAQSGQYLPGCSTPSQMPGRELEQLKQEALRTRNPQLMTLVGEAYQRQRAGMGDISQAYRWYVLGAVRGDPQAMTRLSEMYRRGQGTAPDRVRALGYAQLAQRVAPDSAAGKQAAQTVRALRKSMANHELAQADRFAEELAQQMSRGTPGHEAPGPWGLPSAVGAAPVLDGKRLPGAPQMMAPVAAPGAAQGTASGKGTAAPAAAQKTAPTGHAQAGAAWGAAPGAWPVPGQPVSGYGQVNVGAGVLPGQATATSAQATLGLPTGAADAPAAGVAPSGKRSGAGAKAARQPMPAVLSAQPMPVAPVELRPSAPPAETAASAAPAAP